MHIIHKFRKTLLSSFIFSFLAIVAITSTNSLADNNKGKDKDGIKIAELLTQRETPDGVVFELIGSENNDYLPNALKKIEAYKKQLLVKFQALK